MILCVKHHVFLIGGATRLAQLELHPKRGDVDLTMLICVAVCATCVVCAVYAACTVSAVRAACAVCVCVCVCCVCGAWGVCGVCGVCCVCDEHGVCGGAVLYGALSDISYGTGFDVQDDAS
eukprot:2674555-Pyramimonas_sp.AAC.1